MRRLGVLGRADYGGIASQSLAVARHMPNVNACLVLDLGEKGRGPFDPAPWLKLDCDVRVASFPFTNDDLDWILSASDVIYAAEGPPPFRDDFVQAAGFAEVEFVIHVNPELWRARYDGPTVTKALPTSWHAERFPDAVDLPMPIDVNVKRSKHRTSTVLFHIAAPAMDDRNGSDLVRAALPYVRTPCRLLTRGVAEHGHPVNEQIGQVSIEHLPAVADSRDVIPNVAATMVLPRRYGGLSLPMMEAAARGVPTITLDLPPQREWAEEGGPFVLVPVTDTPHYAAMIGGSEPVWDADPRAVAEEIEAAIRIDWSSRARVWAQSRSWETLLPRWLEVLG